MRIQSYQPSITSCLNDLIKISKRETMCTRVFNNWNSNYLVTARNMDWMFTLPTSLFIFDKGLKKTGIEVPNNPNLIDTDYHNPLNWTSSYKSVVAMVGDDCNGWAASDGMNEMGLVANVLYDSGTTYSSTNNCTKKQLSVLRWLQYVLDKFILVKEVVDKFSQQNIAILPAEVPNSEGKQATLHLSVSDISGDSAIIEIRNGQFEIYHNSSFRVMTNEPSFAKQLIMDQYWAWQWSEQNTQPSHTIPGGPYSTDRFERATFYLNHLALAKDENMALAQARTVAANASVPSGYNFTNTDSPNISNTLWTTLAAHRSQKYFFINANALNISWIDLKSFESDTPTVKYPLIFISEHDVTRHSQESGDLSKLFTKTSDPYKRG